MKKDLFWTVNEVSDYLGIHVKTVYKIAKDLPGYLKIRGVIRFNRETFIEHSKGLIPKPERRAGIRHGV